MARELIKDKSKIVSTWNQQQKIDTNVENNYAKQKETNNRYKLWLWLEAKIKIEAANEELRQRGFLEISKCGDYFYKLNEMKLAGLDLGRKYTSWWLRSNVWYAVYIKNHWIWLIGTFIAGIIATLIAQWLSKVIM